MVVGIQPAPICERIFMAAQSTIEATRDTRIVAPWLTVVRAIWIALVLAVIGLFIAGISPRFDELRVICAGEDCTVLSLSSLEADALRDFGLSLEFYAGYHVVLEVLLAGAFALLGILIFWRRSDDWIGIMVSAAIIFLGRTSW